MSQDLRRSERIKSKNSERAPQASGVSQPSLFEKETPLLSVLEAAADMDIDAAAILAEIRASREELRTFREETNSHFETLNMSVSEIRQTVSALSDRMDAAEGRVAEIENGCSLNQRLISYLLKREKQLELHCEMLECASRRNNVRIYGCAEGLESGNVAVWGEKFIKEVLKLPPETELRLERMHRSLVKKPDATAPPRSFIAKFLDFQTKEKILSLAWKSKDLRYKDNKIGFDNDYPPSVQRRRKEYADIKKQLKAKNISFKSRHPARLLVELPRGPKIFSSASEAAKGLEEHGIKTTLSEWEKLEKEQRRIGWCVTGREGTGGAAGRRAVLRDAMELLKLSDS